MRYINKRLFINVVYARLRVFRTHKVITEYFRLVAANIQSKLYSYSAEIKYLNL